MMFDLPLSLEIFVGVKFCGFRGLLEKIIHNNQNIYMVDTFIFINPQNFKLMKISSDNVKL